MRAHMVVQAADDAPGRRGLVPGGVCPGRGTASFPWFLPIFLLEGRLPGHIFARDADGERRAPAWRVGRISPDRG